MIGPVMVRSGAVAGGVPLVYGRRQGWYHRVPIRVPVYRIRRRRRGRTVPDRRRRWFVVLTVAMVVTMMLLVVVVMVVVRRGGGSAAGRHDVHRGRRQRWRHPAVRAVHRAQRTRPVLGRRALPCGSGGGGGDGRGRGGGAPRLVVVDVLVELHDGGARSTDADNASQRYYRRRRRCCCCCRRRLYSLVDRPAATAITVSYDARTRARGANALEKCCFFLRSGTSPYICIILYSPFAHHPLVFFIAYRGSSSSSAVAAAAASSSSTTSPSSSSLTAHHRSPPLLSLPRIIRRACRESRL